MVSKWWPRNGVLMPIGTGKRYHYAVDGKSLPGVQEYEDLGVTRSHYSSTTAQLTNVLGRYSRFSEHSNTFRRRRFEIYIPPM